jgi:carboxymethylenebutenolidase
MAGWADIDIKTPDGDMAAQLHIPGGALKGTAVLFMDGFGPRPALFDIGEAVGRLGYRVFLPNLYYRWPEALPIDMASVLSGGEAAGPFYARIAQIDEDMVVSDVRAIADYLRSAFAPGERLAALGYCLGGRYALSFAGVADCAAALSIHGAALITDHPSSAHQLACRSKGKVYVAAAEHDPTFSPEEREALIKAFAGSPDRQVELYEGAWHGFGVKDLPVFNPQAAARVWDAAAELLS